MRNEVIRTGCDLKYKLSESVSQLVLRWYEHMGKMNEERLIKQIYV